MNIINKLNFLDAFTIALSAFLLLILLFTNEKKMKISRMLVVIFPIPAFLSIYQIAINGFQICMMGMYAGALLSLVCLFLNRHNVRRVISALAVIGMIGTIYPCLVSPEYNKPDYLTEFYEVLDTMEEHYVLRYYKEIDFDQLREEYTARFKEAERLRDLNLWYAAWYDFTKEFHDGHVYIGVNSGTTDYWNAYKYSHAGYDYGFSCITMSDGRVVFANVEPESDAYACGVRDGLTLLCFDGEDVDYLKSTNHIWYMGFQDTVVEQFFAALTIPMNGGETAEIKFVNEQGEIVDVVIECYGESGYDRYRKTLYQLLQTVDPMYDADQIPNNLSYEILSDDTAILYINDMLIPTTGIDYSGYIEEAGSSEMYAVMKALLRDELLAIKEAGCTKLIIDLRANGGGYLNAAIAMAELFTDETKVALYEGELVGDNGEYEIGTAAYIHGENIWGDGEIVVLVNNDTASGGEHIEYYLGQLDNVTLMGFTKSNGSAQAISQMEFDRISICFPILMLLDPDGNILIDSAADRVINLELDVYVPMDDQAFEAIFINNEDYLLSYAMDYLSQFE